MLLHPPQYSIHIIIIPHIPISQYIPYFHSRTIPFNYPLCEW
jgi:hypothetical protein